MSPTVVLFLFFLLLLQLHLSCCVLLNKIPPNYSQVKFTKRGVPIPSIVEHHPVTFFVYRPKSMELLTSSLYKRSELTTSSDLTSDILKHENHILIELHSASLGSMKLEVEKHLDWLSPGFQVIRGGTNISSFQTVTVPVHCYYKGKVVGNPSSTVALSTCDGLNGVIQTNDTWVLHPLKKDIASFSGSHLIPRNVEDHVLVKDIPSISTCYNGNTTSWASPFLVSPSTINPSNDSGSIAQSSTSKTIDLMLVSDYARYQLFGSYTESTVLELMNYATAVMNQAGALLGPSTSLSLRLVGIFTATSPLLETDLSPSSTTNADVLLTSFCRWRYQQAQTSSLASTFFALNDVGHLLTGQQVTSSSSSIGSATIQGYSTTGSMCYSPASCGFEVSRLSSMLATQAHVLIHELGHNLGATHDGQGNTCALNGFLMESNLCEACGALSTQWSECTKSQVQAFMNTRDTSCLDDRSTLCGNGLLDPGEQCDPGSLLGSNCCHSNCTLKSTAQCDDRNGACCRNCQLLAKDTPCGSLIKGDVRESCDVVDVCTGTSAVCPNLVQPNGTSCFTNSSRSNQLDGRCYLGVCSSRLYACEKLGYMYLNQCETSTPPCLLQCWNPTSRSCVTFTYPSTPSKPVYVPDYSNCTVNGQSGNCILGQCIPSFASLRYHKGYLQFIMVLLSWALWVDYV